MSKEVENDAATGSSQPNWWRPAAVFIIVATPAVASFLAIRVLGDFFYQPSGGVSRPLWIAQALGVALVVTVTFQLLLRKVQKSQALGGLSSLLEVPTVGAIGATSAIPASAPFIAAVAVASVAGGAAIPAELPEALAFEDAIEVEVELGDSGPIAGEVDVPVNREVGVADDTVTTTIVADFTGGEIGDSADQDSVDGEQGSTSSIGNDSTTGSTTTTTASPNAATLPTSNDASPIPAPPSTAAPTTPSTAAPTTAAPGRPTPTTAAPTTPTTAAPTTAAPTTTTTSAPATTTTAPPAPPAPPSAPEAPTGTGFEILNPSQVTSLVEGETEVDRGASVLVEQGPITLSGNLQVALADSTRREVGDAPQATIAAGTKVCSYYIHFDVAGGNRQTAAITFDGEILGHTDGSEEQLEATSQFELSGIDYAIEDGAGAGRDDDVWITGNTANFNFKTNSGNRDDVRFFIACG